MRAPTTVHSLGPSQHRYNAGAKDRIFVDALEAIKLLVLDSAGDVGYSIPSLLDDVFSDKADANLEKLRRALRPNKASFISCFSSSKEFSATGEKLLAYLAAIHNPKCLHLDGSINVAATQATIRRLLGDGQLSLDASAIQNMRLDTENSNLNVYGKSRRSDARLASDFPSINEFRGALTKKFAHETKGLEQLDDARQFDARCWNKELDAQSVDLPALCMALNLDAIPRLKDTHTVHDCVEIVLGDMHGNVVNMLHQLVTTGYLNIVDEFSFKELVRFAEHAVPQLSPQQLQRMAELEVKIKCMGPLSTGERARRIALKGQEVKTPDEVAEYNALQERFAGKELNRLEIEYSRLKFMYTRAQEADAIVVSDPYALNRQFRQLMIDAMACPDAVAGCKLILEGDLLFDGGQNDLFIYTALEFLLENNVDYDIIYSNHDAEAIAWFHSNCDLSAIDYRHSNGGVQAQKGMHLPEDDTSDEMKGSKFQSTVALDLMCQQSRQFKEDVRALIHRVYLGTRLKLVGTSREGTVLYAHTGVNNAMLQDMVRYAVPHAAEHRTELQVKALDAWFREMVNDKDQYFKATAWEGQDLVHRKLSPLINFVTYVGVNREAGEDPVQIDLNLPPEIVGVVHGHTKKLFGLTATGEVDDKDKEDAERRGLIGGWFSNPEQGPHYFSIDGGVGEKGGRQMGLRRYFAIPKPEVGFGASDSFIESEEGSLRV